MMTSAVSASGAVTPDRSLTRDGWPRGHRVWGWVLAAGVLVLAVTWMTAGAKHVEYDSFTDALESGEVSAIEVADAREVTPDANGFFTLDVYWRDKFRPRVSRVTQASSERQERSALRNGADVVVVTDDLVAEWKEVQPELKVTKRPRHTGSTLRGRTDGDGGHELPGWAGFLAMFVVLGVFVQIVRGPQPLRATRWGWFWLLLWVPTLTVPAYLLLGGPLGLGGRPRTTFRVNGPLVVVIALGVALATALL